VETHGFTHHQKTAMMDRVGSDGRRHLVVFSGGLDLAERMTDSSEHPLEAWRGSASPAPDFLNTCVANNQWWS